MAVADSMPSSGLLSRSILRRYVKAPCKRLMLRCFRGMEALKRSKSSHEDLRCTAPYSSGDSVASDTTSTSDGRSYLSPSSCSESNSGDEISDSERSSSGYSYSHSDDDGDTSHPGMTSLGPSAVGADVAEHTPAAEETVPWREVFLLLKNEAFTRNHEIQSLKEEHEAELASVTEERDEALRVVEELIAERDKLLKEKMEWQLKFTSAVAKKHRPASRRQNTQPAIASSTADEEPPESPEPESSADQPGDQDVDPQTMQQDAQHGMALEWATGHPGNAPHDPDIPGIPPERTRSQLFEELIQCKQGIRYVEISVGAYDSALDKNVAEREFTEFQLRQDLGAALEAKQHLQQELQGVQHIRQLLQQQVDGQAEEYWYMRHIFAELSRRLAALDNENADPKARLEAIIGENVILTARHKRDRFALKEALKKQPSRLMRIDKRHPPRYWRLREFPAPVALNLRSFKAQLLSHRRLLSAVMRQNSIYLDNFKTAISWSQSHIEKDDLAVQLADVLRRTLDRNEELEGQVWNFRHPETHQHFWLERDSGG